MLRDYSGWKRPLRIMSLCLEQDYIKVRRKTMNILTDELKKKISGCEFFIVLSTKNYLKALRNSDEEILTQINLARELKKPFFIVEDSRLSQSEKEEMRRYFSNDNIIERIAVNIENKNSRKLLAKKIIYVTRMFRPQDKSINIVTNDKD